MARPKRTKEFCSVWAEKLSASNKNSYIYNQEMWLEKPREQQEHRVRKPLKDTAELLQHAKREDDNVYCKESWQRLKGTMNMRGETLVEKLDEAVCCRFCHLEETSRKRKLQK